MPIKVADSIGSRKETYVERTRSIQYLENGDVKKGYRVTYTLLGSLLIICNYLFEKPKIRIQLLTIHYLPLARLEQHRARLSAQECEPCFVERIES